jgi:hypothetical protein
MAAEKQLKSEEPNALIHKMSHQSLKKGRTKERSGSCSTFRFPVRLLWDMGYGGRMICLMRKIPFSGNKKGRA